MTFCNPGPIAASCYLGKDVVASSHAAFIQAIIDLTTLGIKSNLLFFVVRITKNLFFET